MKYVNLGKTGERIPAVGIGTWQLHADADSSVKAIRASLESGSNFVDTAESYRNEEMVGRAIEGYDNVFLATKVWPSHFRYDRLLKACDESLRKLGREYIDLYQLHWPNPKVDISETMRAMEKLVDDGRVRHIGVSNFSSGQLRKAQDAMKNYSIVSNQIEFSMLAREYEKELLPFSQDNDITVIAYSPLGHGKFFTSRNRALPTIQDMAHKYGKSPAQIAINWLISRSNVVAIPKAGTIEHVKDNIEAGNFEMSVEDLSALDDAVSGMNFRTMKSKFGWLISFVLRLI